MRKIFTLFVLFALTALGAAQAQNLEVDFEKPLADYTDWEFTKMARTLTRGAEGTAAGINAKADTEAHTGGNSNAYMITVNPIAKPQKLTLQYTKLHPKNTTATNFIEVSVTDSDGNEEVVSTGMNNSLLTANKYESLDVDLSKYSNVKIKISIKGNTSLRAIDNVVLTVAGEGSKKVQSLSYFVPTHNLVMGTNDYKNFKAPALQGAKTTVTYASSNQEVAKVDASTGDITLGNQTGTATITATAAETAEYYGATTSYTINVEASLANIKEANLLALNKSTEGRYLTFDNAVVTYVNGKNAFIQDASGAILLYLDSHGLKAGQKLNGVASVTLTNYNGLPELTALNKTEVTITDGTEPAPTPAQLADITKTDNDSKAKHLNTYVTFDEVAEVTKVGKPAKDGAYTLTVKLGSSSLDVRVNDGSLTFKVGDKLKLKGFVGIYKTTFQLATYAPEHLVRVLPLTSNPAQSEGKSIHVATFYNTTDNVILPANVKAYTATIEGSKVTTTEFLSGGEVLNAGTPVILMANEAFSGVMETTTTKNTKTTPTNALLGADDNNAITETGKRFYVLTLHPTTNELGFFFQSSNPAGDKLTNHAGKAYLKLDAAQAPAQGFTLGATVTAIEATTLEKAAPLYDLSGRRVSRASKGIFIQNGQKKVFN